MKKRPLDLHRILAATLACAVLVVLAPACGDDGNPVDPKDRVCGGTSGFGARVTGRAQPVDVCASDDAATVFLNNDNNYSVLARMDSGGVVYEFQLVFPNRPDAPIVLTLYDDLGLALADPQGVWVYYQETPSQGESIESFQITGGTFTLSFSDGNVLTATMQNVTMKMQTQATPPTEMGTRAVEKGFLSLSVDG